MLGSSQRKLRITYILPGLAVGGAEQSLLRLVSSLDRAKFELSIVCLDRRGALADELPGDVRIRLLRIRAEGSGRFIRRLARLLLLVKELILLKPDIVHGYLPAGYIMAALGGRLIGTPLVLATRMTIMSIKDTPGRVLQFVAGPVNRAIDFHICDSEAGQEVMISTEAIDVAKSAVIHSGTVIPDPLRRPDPLPDAWGVLDREMTAGSIANLRWQKGHQFLIQATRDVVDVYSRFRLVLIGDGPERARLEAQIASLGLSANVILAGSLLQAADLLPAFHISVLASVEESFPNALVESMAAGVPVVATGVGGIPELVRDGVDGFLVPPGDAKALARAILKLLAEPGLRDQMGASARSRIESHFSIEHMVDQTAALYMRLFWARRGVC